MKILKNLYFIFLLVGIDGFSQSLINTGDDLFQNDKKEFDNFVAIPAPTIGLVEVKESLQSNNQVFVEQIGVGNDINANISAQ
ncbi:hypothetical protein [Salinimicrobium terrae]|uniref:hypothetical protein n=1 Tax=Salinimicrobium terrae TaxID=470866 RepID=UPI000403F253|nr:hypothetical protein [Salinimicrobium terrae]